MNVDGNMMALNRHLAEQEDNERAYQAFVDEVEEQQIFSRYEDLKEEFFGVMNKYGYDLKFDDFIRDNL